MHSLSEISISDLHGSSTEKRYLITVGDSYFEANESTADLLSTLSRADSIDSGISEYASRHPECPHEQVSELVYNKLIPKLNNEAKPRRQFLYQRQIIPAEYIDRISDALSVLFRLPVMLALIVSGVALDVYFLASTPGLLAYGNRVDALTIVCVLLFMVGSSMLHEFGHAAASKHYGLRHGGIGFGLYINFPVLYTDVTSVWRLTRRQRCVVNIAGVYFQMIMLIFLIVIHLTTGNDTVRYMIAVTNIGFILTLNPFFKFDGYWLATDLLGVPNLRRRTKELLKYCLDRVLRRVSETPRPYILGIKSQAKIAAIVYAVVVNLFMGYYFLYIIPMFFCGFFESFPGETRELLVCMANRVMPPFALLHNIFSQLLFLSLILFMLYRMSAPRIRKIIGHYASA